MNRRFQRLLAPRPSLIALLCLLALIAGAPPNHSHAQSTPSGRLLLVIDGQLNALSLSDNNITALETTNIVGGILTSPDDSRFAVLSRQNGTLITIYDSASLAILNTIALPITYNQWIGWSPDGQWVAAGTSNSGAVVAHVSDGRIVGNLPVLGSDNLIWLADSRLLVRLGGVGFPFFVIDPQNSDPNSYETLELLPFVTTATGYLPLDLYGIVMAEAGNPVAAPPFFLHSAVLQPDHSSISIQLYNQTQTCAEWAIAQTIPFDPNATPEPNAEPDPLTGQTILYQTEAHALSHLSVLDAGLLFVKWELSDCSAEGIVKGRLLLVTRDGVELQLATDIRLSSDRIVPLAPGGRPYAVIGAGNLIAFAQAAIVPTDDPDQPEAVQQAIRIYNRAELLTTTALELEPGAVINDMVWLP